MMPDHGELDKERESNKKGVGMGTSGLGIGPGFVDKVVRREIRLCDLSDRVVLAESLDMALDKHNSLR